MRKYLQSPRVMLTHPLKQDGVLKFTEQGRKGSLYDDSGNKIGSVYAKPENVAVGDEIESDRHLITIEDELRPLATPTSNRVATNVIPEGRSKMGNASHRIMPSFQPKFQVPQRRVGGLRENQSNQSEYRSAMSSQSTGQTAQLASEGGLGLGKRKRLGSFSNRRELVNFHKTGDVHSQASATSNGSDDDVIVTNFSSQSAPNTDMHGSGIGHRLRRNQTCDGNAVRSDLLARVDQFRQDTTNTQMTQTRRSLGQIMGLLQPRAGVEGSSGGLSGERETLHSVTLSQSPFHCSYELPQSHSHSSHTSMQSHSCLSHTSMQSDSSSRCTSFSLAQAADSKFSSYEESVQDRVQNYALDFPESEELQPFAVYTDEEQACPSLQDHFPDPRSPASTPCPTTYSQLELLPPPSSLKRRKIKNCSTSKGLIELMGGVVSSTVRRRHYDSTSYPESADNQNSLTHLEANLPLYGDCGTPEASSVEYNTPEVNVVPHSDFDAPEMSNLGPCMAVDFHSQLPSEVVPATTTCNVFPGESSDAFAIGFATDQSDCRIDDAFPFGFSNDQSDCMGYGEPSAKRSMHAGRRVLKPLSSNPEDYCASVQKTEGFHSSVNTQTDQLEFGVHRTHQSDCSVGEPMLSTTLCTSVSRLRPVLSSPTDFTSKTGQSDAASGPPRNEEIDNDKLWDSLSEGSQSFSSPTLEAIMEAEFVQSDELTDTTDQSNDFTRNGGGSLVEFTSQSNHQSEHRIQIQTNQSSSSAVLTNQSNFAPGPSFSHRSFPVPPRRQFESSFTVQSNFTPIPTPGPPRRKIGLSALRRSKQAFNAPYMQCSSDDLSNSVASSSKMTVDLSKGKFQVPYQSLSGSAASMVEPLRHTAESGNSHTQSSMVGSLRFPSHAEVASSPPPLRHTSLPTHFTSPHHYRQSLSTAIREHLNIILFNLSSRLHRALSNADVRGSRAGAQGSRHTSAPHCKHGPAELRAVKKEGPNKGRLFYSCPVGGPAQCKFFKWADEADKVSSGGRAQPGGPGGKIQLSTPLEIEAYCQSHNVGLYYNCQLARKSVEYKRTGKFVRRGGVRWRQNDDSVLPARKQLFVVLQRRERSSVYGKDDLWVVSQDLNFDPQSSFLAKSTFYGPTSSNHLEISPISGYSPSNWPSEATVCCIHVGNASTELNCLSNLEDHIKPLSLPILPHLLELDIAAKKTALAKGGFVPPVSHCRSNAMATNWSDVMELADKMIGQYCLNADQSEALKHCAQMFNPDSNHPPLTLIHGVFGAGKSYLLTVIVLFLVKIFELQKQWSGHNFSRTPQKLLISSITNVAVDRILLGLLDHSFEDFVRVGSVKKIAKPVLPYSIHSSGTESQELKELQDMMRSEDISAKEKMFVRKSIEQCKLGINKKHLSSVSVVGVTCAASTFPLMEGLVFPVLLLDECSQMTEPASLLPMARFGCERLILVGDPKQLPPTIQGSEAAHENGLEQTMFERLAAMGHDPIMLRTQYRCHPRLSAISNSLFYNGCLADGVSESDREPLTPHLPTLCFLNVTNGREQSGRDGSYFNAEEAKCVVELLEVLLNSDIPAASIGVITLYKSQMFQIKSLVSNCRHGGEMKAVQISTVDAFQGGQREVIILSSVRTQHVGFMDSNRRTNVALTRAKRHLFILGHHQMLSSNEIWGEVIRHCESQPEGIQSATQFIAKLKKES